jgi:hypothetical protein
MTTKNTAGRGVIIKKKVRNFWLGRPGPRPHPTLSWPLVAGIENSKRYPQRSKNATLLFLEVSMSSETGQQEQTLPNPNGYIQKEDKEGEL